MALADIINTHHHFLPIKNKYDTWRQHLTAHHILDNEFSPMTRRRYNILIIPLKHAIHIHVQLQKSLCNTLVRQCNKMIDHKLNINILSETFHMVHPKHHTPPQLCIITTVLQPPANPHSLRTPPPSQPNWPQPKIPTIDNLVHHQGFPHSSTPREPRMTHTQTATLYI